jgi:SAM-dependent methyltransferase
MTEQGGPQRFKAPVQADNQFMLDDSTADLEIDAHYLYHPAWAARILAQIRPAKHVDVSSIINWATTVSAFVPIDYYEFRPPALATLTGFRSETCDLKHLPFGNQSVASLSCMHTVEHVGLGRYGDDLDPDGDLIAMAELQRVLAPGGNLLFVVPVGAARIKFNAHRIYSYEMLRSAFSGLQIIEFMLIPDSGTALLVGDEAIAAVPAQQYGCGCFWFTRPRDGPGGVRQ